MYFSDVMRVIEGKLKEEEFFCEGRNSRNDFQILLDVFMAFNKFIHIHFSWKHQEMLLFGCFQGGLDEN